MSALGQPRRIRDVGDRSGLPPIAAVMLQRRERSKRAIAQSSAERAIDRPLAAMLAGGCREWIVQRRGRDLKTSVIKL